MTGERKRTATRDRTALAAYLGRDGRPEGSLTLPEVRDIEHANMLLGPLQDVYNEVTGLARSDPAPLPSDCVLLDDPCANLDSAAPIAAWSRGFRAGHDWLEESWDVPMSDEMDSEVGSVLTTLIFFRMGEQAESLVAEIAPGRTVAEVAVTMHKIFPEAVEQYAVLGRTIEGALRWMPRQEPNAPPVSLPGRNDPCPCGSGRKFKRCCGMPQH